MNNDFDFPAEFDFESSDNDFLEDDAFDSFGEDDDDGDSDAYSVRTAVLQKNNMVALLCIKSASEGAAICRVDPRENQPAVQLYDDPAKALEWFTKSLRTSRKNGWNVVYDGLPLQG